MRFAAYASTSMVLASGAMVQALHQRSNFYSVCVHLAQSNACLMILTNLALLGLCTTMLGLQRLFYGPLRPIEIEQLYEKAWFAITETCLAMTIFRDEVGGWFLVMFVSLLLSKVWGWIGEGRVELLEQQPPTDPRLFHARLSFSLIISLLFNVSLLRYSIKTVLLQARPNMMVMFAFEFAVLFVTSLSSAARYMISLRESAVIKHQIKARRAQIMQDREQTRQNTVSESNHSSGIPSPGGESTGSEIDAFDIDVPGWEEKGRWLFYLDLATDFSKLILYLTFFCVLCMFYGMPIHIIRDVAMTIRSFYKRINDFVRYRQATRDMNTRYPDATPDEISREDVCIICREDMSVWRPPGQNFAEPPDALGNNIPSSSFLNERLRPKKLPCGHILHFACLRSWLERQQNCPTCRAPVLNSNPAVSNLIPVPPNQQGAPNQQPQNPEHRAAAADLRQPPGRPNVFNLGPFRLVFGRQGLVQQIINPRPLDIQGIAPVAADVEDVGNTAGLVRQVPVVEQRTIADVTPTSIQNQLYNLEQQLIRDINGLQAQADQLYLVSALQDELTRLRATQAHPGVRVSNPQLAIAHGQVHRSSLRVGHLLSSPPSMEVSQQHQQQQPHLTSEGRELPVGMSIPDGWSILPLRRFPRSSDLTFNATSLLTTSDNLLRQNMDDSIEQEGVPTVINSSETLPTYNASNISTNNQSAQTESTTVPGHENRNLSLHSWLGENAAVTRNLTGDENYSETRQICGSQEDIVNRSGSGTQEFAHIPSSPPSQPRWNLSSGSMNQDQRHNLTSNEYSNTFNNGQTNANGDVEEKPNNRTDYSGVKNMKNSATVEDYIEEEE